MRGNPIFRVALLVVALGLAGVLVASVLGKTGRPPRDPAPAPSSASEGALVPTLLTITLSAPAGQITFTEPSGRILTIPAGEDLELEEELELAISDNSWSARLNVAWQDPTRPNFLRLDFEPRKLKSTHLILHFNRNSADLPITTNFNPGP